MTFVFALSRARSRKWLETLRPFTSPNHDTQLSGYMCLSRAEEIEGICIVKPFSPNLFRNGDLRGPDLLLKFQRGDISEEQMEVAWRTESKKVPRPARA